MDGYLFNELFVHEAFLHNSASVLCDAISLVCETWCKHWCPSPNHGRWFLWALPSWYFSGGFPHCWKTNVYSCFNRISPRYFYIDFLKQIPRWKAKPWRSLWLLLAPKATGRGWGRLTIYIRASPARESAIYVHHRFFAKIGCNI